MKTKHKSTLGSRVQMLSGDRLKPKEDAVSLVSRGESGMSAEGGNEQLRNTAPDDDDVQ